MRSKGKMKEWRKPFYTYFEGQKFLMKQQPGVRRKQKTRETIMPTVSLLLQKIFIKNGLITNG